MNTYTAHHMSRAHHQQLIANADHARLLKAARLASHGTAIPARRPMIWLRDAAENMAAWLMVRTSAQAGR